MWDDGDIQVMVRHLLNLNFYTYLWQSREPLPLCITEKIMYLTIFLAHWCHLISSSSVYYLLKSQKCWT